MLPEGNFFRFIILRSAIAPHEKAFESKANNQMSFHVLYFEHIFLEFRSVTRDIYRPKAFIFPSESNKQFVIFYSCLIENYNAKNREIKRWSS